MNVLLAQGAPDPSPALDQLRPRRHDALDARHEAIAAVRDTLLSPGIDLPFPTRQVLFHDHTEETDGDGRRQREGWPAGEGEAPAPRPLAAAARPRQEEPDAALRDRR